MSIRNIRISKHRRKLWILCAIFLLSIVIVNVHIPLPGFVMKAYYWIKPRAGVFCHSLKGIQSLPEVSDANPRKGESIFFHETSCNSIFNGKIVITSRQACAVESAAKLNPDMEVYLLYASPGIFLDENTESDRFLKTLMEYSNVHVLHVDMERYMRETPVEHLWITGKISESQWAQSHTSDVLRFLTLWKYGGIYLDLDVIVTKNLDDLGTDFAGVESDTSVAAGILSFNFTGKGHEFASSCINDLKDNFNGHDWGYNGPGTITRLLKRLCGNVKIQAMVSKDCSGFKLHPPSAFYAIPWWDWNWFFDQRHLRDVTELTKDSYLIHVWNKFSSSYKIPLGFKQPYLEYAKKYCPNVVRECDEFF